MKYSLLSIKDDSKQNEDNYNKVYYDDLNMCTTIGVFNFETRPNICKYFLSHVPNSGSMLCKVTQQLWAAFLTVSQSHQSSKKQPHMVNDTCSVQQIQG